MKRYASIVIVLGLILGGIALTRPSVTEYVAPEVQIKVEEVQVDALEKAIRDAQGARKAEIEDIAKKAYDAAYDQEMKKVELEVIRSFGEKLDARQIELEKETGEF